MTANALAHIVDDWTARSVVASRFLIRLYRTLGDERQLNHAVQAGAPSEERAQRLGLSDRLKAMRDIFGDQDEEKLLGEARAWQILVEAQAGICAFHAMAGDDPWKARGLRGARTASTKALDRAVHGYRVAFPDVMAEAGITSALEGAANTCIRGFMEDLAGDGPVEDREVFHESLYRDILGALTKATK